MRDRENRKTRKLVCLVVIAALAITAFLVPRAKSNANAFAEGFNRNCSLEEAGDMEESASSEWWVNSGGLMNCRKKAGWTIQGKLSPGSKWRKLYAETNSEDTDQGTHPQNIFRLITRSEWQNFSQEARFKIKKFNLSDSENRNESNGLLLMNRYQDSDDLYYAGVRVDGFAVIKKKIGGKYYEMAYNRYFSAKEYSRQSKSRSHLLPKKKWISLRTEIRDIDGGKVEIKLFVKQKKRWNLAAEAVDEPGKYGGDVLSGEGHAGIRTDFMDVEFDKYRIADL
jgi:hypothetical protein